MAERAPLRTVEEHLAAVLAATTPLPDVDLPLLDALDLRCADDVHSPLRLPRFDNSAMDGYAVRATEVADADADAPVRLPVAGAIGAGQAQEREPVGEGGALPVGAVAKIMTGAPLPPGADAVVPYEWTDRGSDEVRVDRPAEAGAHVRYAGEDVEQGDLLVEAGCVLGPRQLGLLASVGHATVRARRRPRVVVVSTGSELREPGTTLDPERDADAIFDGGSFLLAAAARRAGAVTRRVGLVRDDPEAFLETLRSLLPDADVVVTSGGISMGDYDVVKAALRDCGPDVGAVWFGGLAMQPGKPQGFGHLVDPADATRSVPFFALPGNPVSSYISFEMFVRPTLRRMAGRQPESRPVVRARLTHAVRSPQGRRQFLRGTVTTGADGVTVTEVEPVGGSGSHLVGDLASSDALIVVPEAVTAVAAGERVDVVLLDQE